MKKIDLKKIKLLQDTKNTNSKLSLLNFKTNLKLIFNEVLDNIKTNYKILEQKMIKDKQLNNKIIKDYENYIKKGITPYKPYVEFSIYCKYKKFYNNEKLNKDLKEQILELLIKKIEQKIKFITYIDNSNINKVLFDLKVYDYITLMLRNFVSNKYSVDKRTEEEMGLNLLFSGWVTEDYVKQLLNKNYKNIKVENNANDKNRNFLNTVNTVCDLKLISNNNTIPLEIMVCNNVLNLKTDKLYGSKIDRPFGLLKNNNPLMVVTPDGFILITAIELINIIKNNKLTFKYYDKYKQKPYYSINIKLLKEYNHSKNEIINENFMKEYLNKLILNKYEKKDIIKIFKKLIAIKQNKDIMITEGKYNNKDKELITIKELFDNNNFYYLNKIIELANKYKSKQYIKYIDFIIQNVVNNVDYIKQIENIKISDIQNLKNKIEINYIDLIKNDKDIKNIKDKFKLDYFNFIKNLNQYYDNDLIKKEYNKLKEKIDIDNLKEKVNIKEKEYNIKLKDIKKIENIKETELEIFKDNKIKNKQLKNNNNNNYLK